MKERTVRRRLRRFSRAQRWAAAAGAAAVAAGLLLVLAPWKKSDSASVPVIPFEQVLEDFTEPGDYREYIRQCAAGSETVAVNLATAVWSGGDSRFETGIGGETARVLYAPETGDLTLTVEVPAEGLYRIAVTYYPGAQTQSDIQRRVTVNGELPYDEAKAVGLPLCWEDRERDLRDANGNELRSSQVQKYRWQTAELRDGEGYVTEPLLFRFRQGTNTLTFTAVRESMYIGAVTLRPPQQLPSYAQVAADYGTEGAVTGVQPITVQGEAAFEKSDATLYPSYDRSTPSTDPYDSAVWRLNKIGGSAWEYPGQRLTWQFRVETSGLYRLELKVRQNLYEGSVSSRRLLLDGEVPFAEAESLKIGYSSGWQSIVPGDENGDWLFYLEAGEHTVSLEVTLGELGPVLYAARKSLNRLNAIYRSIVTVTGTTPDPMRDYRMAELLPETVQEIAAQAAAVSGIYRELVERIGQKGGSMSVLNTLTWQMQRMAEDPEIIPKQLSYFKSNIGAFGTWLNEALLQPLEVDYMTWCGADTELRRPNAGLWESVKFQAVSFYRSFSTDYNALGDRGEAAGHTVTVWISSGRDQAQVLKSLLNDSFIPQTGTGVKLELVAQGTLLTATVAGIGPDVALGLGQGEPVNYALRGAALSLNDMPGFAEVQSRFREELAVPLYWDGRCYALPETQGFPVLFYRTDILEELGLSVPDTWDDVIGMLPILQKHSMTFGLPSSTVLNPSGGLPVFYTLLLQNGSRIYRDDPVSCALDEEGAVEAFRRWTEFYQNYSLPLETDFMSRFRTGEIPVGVSDISLYNSLAVTAPEIKGFWEIAPVPGTVREDGSVDHAAVYSASCSMILADSRYPEEAWEFLEWWTRTETQTRYAREMESILGSSARYMAANRETFAGLNWSYDEAAVLEAQQAVCRGIPETAGSYFLPRHLTNAFRRVVLHSEDAKDTLLDYVYTINQEIQIKREEFHLDS